jgi:elongation factor G
MNDRRQPGSRSIAIVGPYLSGKTTLLESLLSIAGALSRKGSTAEKNTVGDSSPEARDRAMTVHSVGILLNFLDCPGSVEFSQEAYSALIGVDAAIVVCEPLVDRVLSLTPLFKFLDDWAIPHWVFLNKMDRADVDFMQVLHALCAVSSRPIVPQQFPIGRGESLKGFIDLVTEEAFHYGVEGPVPFPQALKPQEQDARMEMLEALADFDDQLLEELLEDVTPDRAQIEADLKTDLGDDLIVPAFLGVADRDFGVKPLLDALVQELPQADLMAERRGLAMEGEAIAQVLKTYYSPQGGKLSLVRVWQGELTDGMTLNGVRVGGMYRLMGSQQQSIDRAQAGDIVALGRMEGISTGDTLSANGATVMLKPELLPPVYALAIVAEKRSDEVKLTTALNKLLEEDPALHWENHGDTHEVILWGQGEIHLQVALDRLRRKYNLPMNTHLPQVPYKETIRKSTQSHGRYKHQTGGHGQFGDVFLEIKPIDRGEGFHFTDRIVGGVVPKQYIPGVESGVREFLDQGPLGFPVVDVAVTLTNGSYHSVDSSEQAFKQAARIAMQSGMDQCQPVLLEPIVRNTISVPMEFTAKVLRLVTGRRGQILGYDAKADWSGWDEVEALIPMAEIQDLIVELRSLSMGVGSFQWEHHHLQEVPEKLAEQVRLVHS